LDGSGHSRALKTEGYRQDRAGDHPSSFADLRATGRKQRGLFGIRRVILISTGQSIGF
jgi:hypothetical protein